MTSPVFDLQLLRELVGIDSVLTNEGSIGSYLEQWLKSHQFDVERQYLDKEKNRFNVLAEKGSSKPCVLVYGHLDTVPPYGSWHSDPFTLTQKGDSLYGLGTSDMKGGIAAALSAIKAIEPDGYKLKVAFGVDEERNSAGAFLLYNSGWLSDVDYVYVPEVGTTHSPEGKAIIIGRRGRITIRLEVPGASSHGASAHQGINAIEQAAKIVLNLGRIELPDYKGMGKGNIYAVGIESSVESLSVPDRCTLELERHLVVGESADEAIEQVRKLAEQLLDEGALAKVPGGVDIKAYLKPRNEPYLLPYCMDIRHPFVEFTSKMVDSVSGSHTFQYGLSVADECIFGAVAGLPTLVLGPEGGNEHRANEWVSLRSLDELTKIYATIFRKISNLGAY